MTPYLLVNGNFVKTNGMDMPNLAIARYLAAQGNEVHLVTHYADGELTNNSNVTVHQVRKLGNSYLLSTPSLNREGRRWARKISERNGHVLVNGGNCLWGDVNWVHYVHAAFPQSISGSMLRAVKDRVAYRTFLYRERIALSQARLVITNSDRTRRDVIERLGVAEERVHTVYYGIDRDAFRSPTDDERITARDKLGWRSDRKVVAFVGALGDRRKGFDTLFTAWQELCIVKDWDGILVVIGSGAELPAWKARAAHVGLQDRISFLGFRKDVPQVLAACDALVAPTRYEAYGQGVHEALCCGLPAIVSRSAGVAERYSADLSDLLLDDPENVDELVGRLRDWRRRSNDYWSALGTLSKQLRAHTWNDMAAEIVQLTESG